MTTSGTIGSTLVTVDTLLATAIRRCGKKSSEITPEWVEIARNALFYFLTALGSRGINFWRLQRRLIPMVAGTGEYIMPVGTVDVVNALWRTMVYPAGGTPFSTEGIAANAFDGDPSTVCTQITPNGYIGYDFGVPIAGQQCVMTTWGFKPALTTTLTLALESSADMLTWTLVKQLPATSFPAGQMQLFDLDLTSVVTARAFRIRETNNGILVMNEVAFCQNPNDITMAPMNHDIYASMPNKGFLSNRSLQWWYDRQRDQPHMVLWPVPNDSRAAINAFIHMHVEDPGDLPNQIDVPTRWYDAVAANLTYRVGLELPDVDGERLVNVLKPEAADRLREAEDDEYGRGPINLTVNIQPYTA